MREYFPEPNYSRGRVKVEFHLYSYVRKGALKNATCVNTSKRLI